MVPREPPDRHGRACKAALFSCPLPKCSVCPHCVTEPKGRDGNSRVGASFRVQHWGPWAWGSVSIQVLLPDALPSFGFVFSSSCL